MGISISFEKPIIYQSRRNFINCKEYLVCSFIQAHQLPYQWLLSDSWGFYYDTMESISPTKKGEPSPFWINLQKLYAVETKKYQNKNLLDVMQDTISRNTCLFTFGEGWHIPWHTYAYQKAYAPHYFLITDYDKSSNQVFVVDWVPEYSGWVNLEVINQAYLARGSKSFELTDPSLNISTNFLNDQLHSCYNKIIGGSSFVYLSGIQGLRKFKEDVMEMEGDSKNITDTWLDVFRAIVNVRDGFIEFVHYLDKDPGSPYNSNIDPQFLSILDQTLNTWFAFRNGLMRSKMTGVFDAHRNAERLEKIIVLENQCADELKKIIN